MAVINGASGTPGMIDLALDALLSPIALIDFNLIIYVVPLVRPVMTTGDNVSAGLNAVNVVPLSMEYR